MRFISLASGSSGNSELIQNNKTNILIDCGISYKNLVEKLEEYNLTLDDIDYIFITHEHIDHIRALKKILENHNVKAVALKETLISFLNKNDNIKKPIDKQKLFPLPNENKILNINDDIKIEAFLSHHDVPCVFYKFYTGDIISTILTDCGTYDDDILEILKDVQYLMLECNYDKEMLLESKYPDSIKARIASKNGHMSNVDCVKIINKIYTKKNLKKVFLSHISENSNTEELALEYVKENLKNKIDDDFIDNNIFVSKRHDKTIIFDI